MWQNVKFTSFFMSTKNLHIKSFTLIPSRLLFYVKVKIYTSSFLHCYQLPMFFNESTYLLIKFLALISSFLYLYGVQFFPCLHNFDEGIKNICQVLSFINQEGLVITRLKELGQSGNCTCFEIQHGRSYEFLHNVEECFETILSLFNQSDARLELRGGDQAEFLSRGLEQYEQTLCIMYQCLTETRGNKCLRAFISCSTSCLIASWRWHVSVRHWYITRKVRSYCSNLLDKNSAWSPSRSRNSKHALLWVNNDKIVSKIPPRCEEIHSHSHVEFQST